MSGPNAELAYRVLDQIDADPGSWNQNVWWCGTSGCFAGHALKLAGAELVLDADDDLALVRIGGNEWSVVEVAACHVLGIETDEVPGTRYRCECGCREQFQSGLFDASNARAELGRFVEAIFGPRPGGPS